MLEMMIALAIRCEETIMDDPRYGNRTKQWFWNMMKSLGLSYMNDDCFDRDKFHEIRINFQNETINQTVKWVIHDKRLL